ncbi:MAG: hypothetical protein QOC92_491 [Acidimicrobiaceae bacterium]|jgi:hypothetical protein
MGLRSVRRVGLVAVVVLTFLAPPAVAKSDNGKGQGHQGQGQGHQGQGQGQGEGAGQTKDTEEPASSERGGGDPAGNNGTIKIDGVPFDDAPDNEPHPGCVFQVDFYGFDAGPLIADLTFEAVAPTLGGVVVTDQVSIGEDSHAGGGSEAGLDASSRYDLRAQLAGIEPHPKQGWHIRLTVHADGSQGSDVKHKVFWVSGCGEGLVAGDASETPTPTSNGGGGGEAAGGTSGTEVLGTGATAAPARSASAEAPAAEVLGETITRDNTTASGPSALARTGIGLGLAVLALALVLGGVTLVRVASLRLARQH